MPESTKTQTLLSNMLIGQPLRNRSGVRCCPAIDNSTNKQYIAKIITIPASQAQADALLLSGAYQTKDEVLEYFRSQANCLIDEIKNLSELNEENLFVPFRSWEILPMTDGIGFRIILLSDFHHNVMQRESGKSWTHLEAFNMALDICTAFESCRQTGNIYANLKPSNIFLCENGTYCIGDFGMIPLASLKYASLPEKYRSAFTPPEINDAYSALNDTVDTYALGMLLYQLYNGNLLPIPNADGSLPYPQYADYNLAQIILKACAPDPANRFHSPSEFANALVGYMQQNGINDVPIIPVSSANEAPAKLVDNFMTEEENEAQFAALLASVQAQMPTDDSPENPQDSGDVLDMLAQADDLISHVLPQPVVAPSVIDLPIPAPLNLDESDDQPIAQDMPLFIPDAEQTDEDEQEAAEPAEPEIISPVEDEPEQTQDDAQEPTATPVRKKPFVFIGIICGVLAVIIAAFLLFYNFYYLQNIDDILIDVQGSSVQITIVSDIRDDLLQIVCVDTYGDTQSPAVKDGKVTISGLDPNMQYHIYVQISGNHKLTGKTSAMFTSTAHTHIREFSAACGRLDGDAVLTFVAEGQSVPAWTIHYSADGEAEKEISFPGNTVTLHSLSVGKEYTFKLLPQGEYTIDGIYEIKYVVQKIVVAENLTAVSGTADSITIQWNLPANVQTQTWVVRCYNENGYENIVETDNTQFTFTGLDLSTGYTFIVSAKNMTKSASISVPADPICISAFAIDESDPATIQLTWESNKAITDWTISYQIDGGEPLTCTATNNEISLPRTPGSTYSVRITLDESYVIGGNHNFIATQS